MSRNSHAIMAQYDCNRERYERLTNIVDSQLRQALKKHNIKIHSISSRIKTLNSLLDKARRKNWTQPFDHIHDMVGFRVVCLFMTDLNEVGKTIRATFDVFEEDDKINGTELNIFGYMSLHLKARLRSHPEKPTEEEIKAIPFEIQVRTIAQDAWASISHHLDYKKDSTIPEELKRDFNALSGLFYVADTHFALLRQEQLKSFIASIEK